LNDEMDIEIMDNVLEYSSDQRVNNFNFDTKRYRPNVMAKSNM